MSRRPGYKWIAAEIERLDPETDYERIWALSTTYYVNDFMMNFLYTVGFPHFILPPHGGQTVGRRNTGPLITQPQKRERDTVHHFWTWFEHGPSSEHTRASVGQVNRLHAGIAKKYPGNYAHNDDFVYTLCWIAAYMHNLRVQIGLPGYTRNQQIAAHRHWREMATLFWTEIGEVTDFPEDFAGMLEYMADYEAVDHPWTREGADCTRAVVDQFADRWFPRGFHFAGRALIHSFFDEPVRRVHRTPVPSRGTVKVMEFGLKAVLVLQERILPDPKLSTPERARRRGRGTAARTAAQT